MELELLIGIGKTMDKQNLKQNLDVSFDEFQTNNSHMKKSGKEM